MADDDATPAKPGVESVSTRVMVAFPFSNIRTEEATEELRELAAIVGDLAAEVASLRPSPEADALTERTRALIAKLKR